jgi:hypothetical protein
MLDTEKDHTFIISGSFHGPLSDLRQPPSFGHEQVPPRNSGSWLFYKKMPKFRVIKLVNHLYSDCKSRMTYTKP